MELIRAGAFAHLAHQGGVNFRHALGGLLLDAVDPGSFSKRPSADRDHARDAFGIEHRITRYDAAVVRPSDEGDLLRAGVRMHRGEVADVCIERGVFDGYGAGLTAAARIVGYDAAFAGELIEMIESLHPAGERDDDDRLAFAGVAVENLEVRADLDDALFHASSPLA